MYSRAVVHVVADEVACVYSCIYLKVNSVETVLVFM